MCRSTFAAETIAAAEALDELFLVTSLTSDTFDRMQKRVLVATPPTLCTDCRSLSVHVETRKLPVTEKRLMVEVSVITQCVDRDEVVLHWVATDVQQADTLTKHTASITLQNTLRDAVWNFE